MVVKNDAKVYVTKPFDLKVLKTDLHIYIESDEDIIKAEHKIAYLETVIKYIDGVLKSIQSRGWDIKNAISWKQFESWYVMRKWIGYYQNIISDDLCSKLIQYSDNQKPLQPSTYSTSSGKSDRSNERVKMDDGWFRNGEQYYNDIKNCFSTVIKNTEKNTQILFVKDTQILDLTNIQRVGSCLVMWITYIIHMDKSMDIHKHLHYYF